MRERSRCLILMSAWRYMCVVAVLWCPSHNAITDVSTPAFNSAIAALCRRVCGVTCFEPIEGHLAAAALAWLVTSRCTASAGRRVPRGGGRGQPVLTVSLDADVWGGRRH